MKPVEIVLQLHLGHCNLIYPSQQAELDKAIDFLDPIDSDVPKGGEEIMNCENKDVPKL